MASPPRIGWRSLSPSRTRPLRRTATSRRRRARRRLSSLSVTQRFYSPRLPVSLTLIAQLLERQGDRAAALPLAEEGLAIDEKLAALDRTNVTWQDDVAFSRGLVARLRPGDG